MRYIIKFLLAMLGFAGIVLMIGAISSVDIGVMTFHEGMKYILIAISMIAMAFLGTFFTECVSEHSHDKTYGKEKVHD